MRTSPALAVARALTGSAGRYGSKDVRPPGQKGKPKAVLLRALRGASLSCFGEPCPPWRGDACIRVQGLVPGDGSPGGVSRSPDAGQSPALLCVGKLVSSLRVVLFRRRRGCEALESNAFVSDMSA